MSAFAQPGDVVRPATVAEAIAALADGEKQVVAGATWVMRAPVRGEESPRAAVLIGSIPALTEVSISSDKATLGAALSHSALAKALADVPSLQGLVAAASRAANPPIRSVATLGGNLCTAAFAAGDLAPQLLALDATVTYATQAGAREMSMQQYLAERADLRGGLLTHVDVPCGAFRSAHARLPLRKAGDYPVAIVSVAAERGDEGSVRSARIAVGSVEPTPRRWTGLEAALEGHAFDPVTIAALTGALTGEFTGREGVEAPGWYRTKVLPVLVRQAFEALAAQMAERT